MANTVASVFIDYLAGLPATSNICSELGTTLTFSSNLFAWVEPDATSCIVVIPYGGGPPSKEGDRQNPRVQIVTKNPSMHKATKVTQELINTLHGNDKVCKGKVFAIQSSPIVFDVREGGESKLAISNYEVKHVKL